MKLYILLLVMLVYLKRGPIWKTFQILYRPKKYDFI